MKFCLMVPTNSGYRFWVKLSPLKSSELHIVFLIQRTSQPKFLYWNGVLPGGWLEISYQQKQKLLSFVSEKRKKIVSKNLLNLGFVFHLILTHPI